MLSKVFLYVREHGFIAALRRIVDIFLKSRRYIWLYEKYEIYSKDIVSFSSGENEKFIFRQAKDEDISLVAEQFSSHFGDDASESLLQRISTGEILLLGFLKENSQTICFLSWISEIDSLFLESKKVKSLERSVCIYKVLVPQEFRNMKVGRAGIEFVERISHDLGYNEILGYVLFDNIASKKMFEKSGWNVVGELRKFILFGRQSNHVYFNKD
ncbi:MAG: GNAT family N-acetyltransferase [Deltaproteobacteria bacterium]|nr:GNAT family N-acetyltransferase [Deltaproteobacteria bacterium]